LSQTARGRVINVHAFGAAVRLENGELASAPTEDVERNRGVYVRAQSTKKSLEFIVVPAPRHPIAVLAPLTSDDDFEAKVAGYLKQTQEWENPEEAPLHERHFLRKKRRAALFESRHSDDP
jgi:hypothetical protein